MKKNINWSWFPLSSFAFIGAIICSLIIGSSVPSYAQQLSPLKIVTAQGKSYEFNVEVADDEASRQKGLMFRKSMPFNQGMLFDFKAVWPVSMWMKDTYISLDMIFIRPDGVIARIAQNTEPLSTHVIPSGEPVRAVLELVGGTSSNLGIKPGDRVEHALFPK